MLLSMTGFGQARVASEVVTCTTEIRSVNSRFLKVSSRLPETHYVLESRIDKLVREFVRRGTVSVSVRLDRPKAGPRVRITRSVLDAYLGQLGDLAQGNARSALVGPLLSLPGVIEESPEDFSAEADWGTIETSLRESLGQLDRMRRDEGAAMQRELSQTADEAESFVASIEEAAPLALSGLRERVRDRVNGLLAEHGASVEDSDLIREVAILAERSDVAEELARLRSHFTQFREMLGADDSVGRKLEFLTQEMHRESNTIGSKSSDLTVSRYVVELKSRVERIREVIQNVE